MTQRTWNLWFLASTFWVLIHILMAVLDTSKQLMTHWFYMFGMVLSMLNMVFCVYVGSKPSEYED